MYVEHKLLKYFLYGNICENFKVFKEHGGTSIITPYTVLKVYDILNNLNIICVHSHIKNIYFIASLLIFNK